MRRQIAKITEALSYARMGAADGGLPVLTQFAEMARLRFGPFRLKPREYYEQRLYRPELSAEAKAAFVGSEEEAKDVVYRIGNHNWNGIADDKLTTYQFLDGFGLRYPKVVGVGHAYRTCPGAPTLDSAGALADWLREACPFPVFVKPSGLSLGTGCELVESVDRTTDTLHKADGSVVLVDEYVRRNWPRSSGSLIFQEVLRPHAEIARVIGERVATLRIMVLLLPDGPHVHRIAFRIPVGRNMTDNYRSGKSGNMLGRVDAETGDVTGVYTGIGANRRAVERHPDTETPFADWRLPFWPETLDAVRIAATGLRGIPIQGWDVAITPDGPSFVEVNHRGDFDLLQQAEGRGVADEAFLSLLNT